MSNTASISFSGSSPINFGTVELQILSVTTANSPGSFSGAGAGINAIDCMVYNGGTNGAYIVFSQGTAATALNSGGGANGTAQTYIAPGAYVMVKKGQANFFAAITDTSTATLYLHAGRGA